MKKKFGLLNDKIIMLSCIEPLGFSVIVPPGEPKFVSITNLNMFKPQDYDDFELLLKEFDWQLLITDPNSDNVQNWVAKVNGILWDFDSPSSDEFQKKISWLVNLWGGVKAGTINADLNYDVGLVKQFLRNKSEGMRREKAKIFSGDKKISTHTTGVEKDMSKQSYGNIQISGGTVIFGDGNKITQVAIKELVDALSEEIKEKVPEGQEKKNILRSLKEITTNETFASVAGTVIVEVLRRVTRP